MPTGGTPALPAANQRRILLAEQEAIVRVDLAQALRQQGHTIVGTALTAQDAIQLAAALQPQLVVLSDGWRSPFSGLEAVHAIRQMCPAPILFLTIQAQRLTTGLSTVSGFCHLLRKPFSRTEFHQAVNTLLYAAEQR